MSGHLPISVKFRNVARFIVGEGQGFYCGLAETWPNILMVM